MRSLDYDLMTQLRGDLRNVYTAFYGKPML